MLKKIGLVIAMTLLAVTSAACSFGAAPTSTPAASSPAASPFPIRTAFQQSQACMDALASGRLSRVAASGLGLVAAGQPMAVEWPFRYSARDDGGRISLVDETGKVVAREGDEITVGGGLGNAVWHACAPVTVTKAAG